MDYGWQVKVSLQTAHPALPNVIKELNARHLKRGGAATLTYTPAQLLVDVQIYSYKISSGWFWTVAGCWIDQLTIFGSQKSQSIFCQAWPVFLSSSVWNCYLLFLSWKFISSHDSLLFFIRLWFKILNWPPSWGAEEAASTWGWTEKKRM